MAMSSSSRYASAMNRLCTSAMVLVSERKPNVLLSETSRVTVASAARGLMRLSVSAMSRVPRSPTRRAASNVSSAYGA